MVEFRFVWGGVKVTRAPIRAFLSDSYSRLEKIVGFVNVNLNFLCIRSEVFSLSNEKSVPRESTE